MLGKLERGIHKRKSIFKDRCMSVVWSEEAFTINSSEWKIDWNCYFMSVF